MQDGTGSQPAADAHAAAIAARYRYGCWTGTTWRGQSIGCWNCAGIGRRGCQGMPWSSMIPVGLWSPRSSRVRMLRPGAGAASRSVTDGEGGDCIVADRNFARWDFVRHRAREGFCHPPTRANVVGQVQGSGACVGQDARGQALYETSPVSDRDRHGYYPGGPPDHGRVSHAHPPRGDELHISHEPAPQPTPPPCRPPPCMPTGGRRNRLSTFDGRSGV